MLPARVFRRTRTSTSARRDWSIAVHALRDRRCAACHTAVGGAVGGALARGRSTRATRTSAGPHGPSAGMHAAFRRNPVTPYTEERITPRGGCFGVVMLVTFLVPAKQAGDQEPPVPGGSDDPSRPHRCNDCTRRKHGRLDGSGSEWRDRTAQPRVVLHDPDVGRTDDHEQDNPCASNGAGRPLRQHRCGAPAGGGHPARPRFVSLIAGATLLAGCAVPDVASMSPNLPERSRSRRREPSARGCGRRRHRCRPSPPRRSRARPATGRPRPWSERFPAGSPAVTSFRGSLTRKLAAGDRTLVVDYWIDADPATLSRGDPDGRQALRPPRGRRHRPRGRRCRASSRRADDGHRHDAQPTTAASSSSPRRTPTAPR